jgi:hypothetical protein
MPASVQRTVPGLSVMLLLTFWPLPGVRAQQADRPPALPTSDVTVRYRLEGVSPDYPRGMQITYAGAGAEVRIDYFRWSEAKYPYLALIFDRPADRLIAVHPESKSYLERQIGDTSNPGALLAPDMTLTRLGADAVAHAPCTVWKIAVADKADDGGTACVTDDGIVLRLTSRIPTVTTMTATTIHYGAPPEGAFAPPAGFKREPVS